MSIVEYTGPSNPQEIRKYLMRRTKEEIIHEYLRQWRHSGEAERERDAMEKRARAFEAGSEKLQAERDALAASNANISRQHGELQEALAEAREREQALAAHLDKFYSLVSRSGSDDTFDLVVRELINDSPATSLARRDAEKQAEALELLLDPDFISRYGYKPWPQYISARSAELRRRAEGGD